ncbi:unnamed protein product, partial [Pneumocystis jirovecii]
MVSGMRPIILGHTSSKSALEITDGCSFVSSENSGSIKSCGYPSISASSGSKTAVFHQNAPYRKSNVSIGSSNGFGRRNFSDDQRSASSSRSSYSEDIQRLGFFSYNAIGTNGEFSFEKPKDDSVIEHMFVELLNMKNVPLDARGKMMGWSAFKKWQMIYQDALQEYQNKKKWITSHGYEGDKGSPQWFVRKIVDNSIKIKQLSTLSLSLRTQPISWVKSFIKCQGQVALTNVLSHITQRVNKRDDDILKELEILKCLKSLLNNTYGADDAIEHQSCVNSVASSLLSPHLPSRKLAAEVLTFICHWDKPNGHSVVLLAMEHLRSYLGELGRFDAWMRVLELTVDGRGKMGSLVGASDEIRRGGIGVENILMEYALANLFLINSLCNGADDVRERLHIRSQFKTCGYQRMALKMQQFHHDVIDRQLEKFENDEALDYEDLFEKDARDEIRNLDNPLELMGIIWKRIEGTRAQDFFLSTLQHLLLIRDDGEDRSKVFQLIDAILTYVVMDHRMTGMDPTHALNFSIQGVVSKLLTDEEARKAVEEAKEARMIAERVTIERDTMAAEIAAGADGLVGRLKKELMEQAEALETQRRQNAVLRSEVEELQRVHMLQLQKSEIETRELYMIIRDASPEIWKNRKGVLDRKALMDKLEKQLERKKTEFKLEGKAWQNASSSKRLKELHDHMEKLQLDTNDINSQIINDTNQVLQTQDAQENLSFFGSTRIKSNKYSPHTITHHSRSTVRSISANYIHDTKSVCGIQQIVQYKKEHVEENTNYVFMDELSSKIRHFNDNDNMDDIIGHVIFSESQTESTDFDHFGWNDENLSSHPQTQGSQVSFSDENTIHRAYSEA